MAKRKRKGATAVLAPPSEPRVMPGLIGPRRTVPASIRRPPYALSGEPGPSTSDVVRTPDEIEAMRRAGAAAAEVLMIAGSMVAPGVTTDAIDARVHEEAISRNAYPSPLNYRGFPKSVCTSINEVICHGIPDSRQLREGDIINIDVTLYLDGGEDLQLMLDKVEKNGGKVLVPKTPHADENGFFAIFLDSEGNRMGLSSPR